MPSLRILTYNVRYFGHGSRGLASHDRRLLRIARRIAELEGGPPDLLALQEVETRSVRADLGRRRKLTGEDEKPQFQRFVDAFHDALRTAGDETPYHAFYFPAHEYRLSRRRNLYTTGLAILARGDLEVVHDNAHTPHDITHRRVERLARWKQTRIAAHVRLVHRNGQQLDLFNTHLSLPSFFTRELWNYTRRLGHGHNQLEEAQRLLEYIEAASHPDAAAIIVGDFNSLPGSPVHNLLTAQGGLRDAFRELHAIDPPRSGDYPTAGILGLRLPIDYVFSCGQVEWLDFDATHTFGLPEGHFHGLSDHVPLVARLRLPG